MKSIPGINEPYSQAILQLFQNLPKDLEVILFGSRAKGNFREGSDIDIALKGAGATLDLRDNLLSEYDQLEFPWKLDLAIYSFITEPALKEHIDRVGTRLDVG